MLQILFVLLALPAHATEKLTLDRIFASPDISGTTPRALKFSPNGQRLSFLQPKADNYEVLDLWEYDLKTGEPRLLVDSKTIKDVPLSEAEKARRERMRQSSSGIVEYEWSHDGKSIAFPSGGDLYLYEFGKTARKLTKKPFGPIDVKFSPNDHYLSFVRDRDLSILDPKSGREYAVTKGSKEPISYGLAEFIAQEEMDRFTGYWWSEDDQYLAFTRVDESPVEWADRYDIDADKVTVHRERYPRAGTKDAKVKLGIVKVADVLRGRPKIHWVTNDAGDSYLTRAKWSKQGKLSYEIESHDQKTLELFLFDPAKGASRKLLTETQPHWINLNDDLHWLENGDFLWASERTGFEQLYLYHPDGTLARALTEGEHPIDDLEGVDEKEGFAYFSAGLDSQVESQLYRVPLATIAAPTRITQAPGWHHVAMSKDGKFFVDYFSSTSTPPQVTLLHSDGSKVASLSANEVKPGHPLYPYWSSLLPTEFGSFKGPSGDAIYFELLKPRDFDPRKKYPLVVTGYGGPHVQVVRNAWYGKGLWTQLLADQGFVVASFDNRGSARHGKKFEDWLYRGFGTVEVEDQVAGVKYLEDQGFIDPARVGFFGWSYGGYLSLLLATKSTAYKANVAVAPVTDPSLYDTFYTERYMGKPAENKEAYARANVLNFVPQLHGNLLVVHGMADDNVLFTNSTLLFKKLQEEGKLYDSLVYPGAKHGISGRKNQLHVFASVIDFFQSKLAN